MAININILQAGDLDELIGLAAGRDTSQSINSEEEISFAPRVVANNPLLYNFGVSGISDDAELLVDIFRGWDLPDDPEEVHTFKAMRVSYDSYNTSGAFSIDLGRAAAALLWPVDDGEQTYQTEPAERVGYKVGMFVRVLDGAAAELRSINSIIGNGVHQIGDPRGAGDLQWREGAPAPMVVQGGKEFYFYIEGLNDHAGYKTFELRDEDTGAVLTWVIDAYNDGLNRSELRADYLQGARSVGAYTLNDEPVRLNSGHGSNWPSTVWSFYNGAEVSDKGVILRAGNSQLYTKPTDSYTETTNQGQLVLVVDVEGVSYDQYMTIYQGENVTYEANYHYIRTNGRHTILLNNWNGHYFALSNLHAAGTGDILVKSAAFYIIRPEELTNPNFRVEGDAMSGSASGWTLSAETATSRAYAKSLGGLALFGDDAYAMQPTSPLAGKQCELRYFIRDNTTPAASSSSVTIKLSTVSGGTVELYGNPSEPGWHSLGLALPSDVVNMLIMHQGNNTNKTTGVTIDAISLISLTQTQAFERLDHPNLDDGLTTWPTAWTKREDGASSVMKQADGVLLTSSPDDKAAIYQATTGVALGDTVRIFMEWVEDLGVTVAEVVGGAETQTWSFLHGDSDNHREEFSFIATADNPTILVRNTTATDKRTALVVKLGALTAEVIPDTPRQVGAYLTEPTCSDDYFMKWLDRDGIYRFGVFNSYATASTKVGEAVQTDNYIEYLSGASARRTVHSRDIDPTLALHKRLVSSEIYDHYQSLAGSPRAYLLNGSGVWVEVVVEWNPSKPQDLNFHNIDIVVYLGSNYVQNV